jgi:formylmethanofuran dehydrogenase subunit E
MSEYIPDPTDLFLQHDAEQQRKLDRLPVCVECDEPIQDDEYYEINGDPVCIHCLEQNHKMWTEDYID